MMSLAGPFQQFDASGDDFGQQFSYQYGYVRAIWEARYGQNVPHRYQLIEKMDAYGNVTKSVAGQNTRHERQCDAKTGLISTITTGNIQDWRYTFDGLGNLRNRKDEKHRVLTLSGVGTEALDELFEYDALNRLATKGNYHRIVFSRHGIPASYFGGTRFDNSPRLYRWMWCLGCDKSD